MQNHPIIKEFFYRLKSKDIADNKTDADIIKSEISKHLFDYMAIMLYFLFAELEAEQKRENKNITGDSSRFYVGLLSKKEKNNYFYQFYFINKIGNPYQNWIIAYKPYSYVYLNSKKVQKKVLKESAFIRYKLHTVIDKIIEDVSEYGLDSYQNSFMEKFDDKSVCLQAPKPHKKRGLISLSVNDDKSISIFPGKVLVEDDPVIYLTFPVRWDRRSRLLLPNSILKKCVDYRLNMQ